MKIFQVKYDENKYCYYKAEAKELVNNETMVYASYTDCKDEVNNMSLYEITKVRASLIKYFSNDNPRT